MKPSDPLPGASVALVVEGSPARLLWARRTDDAPSLRGFHATPGGLVDPSDARLPHDGGEHAEHRVAALRELFEEAGILRAHGAERLSEDDRASLREALQENDRDAVDRFIDAGLRFRTAELEPIGRWITPEFAPVRYDTRFFALRLDAPIEPSETILEVEMVEWVDVPDAWGRFEAGELLITPPLRWLLDGLRSGALDPEALRGRFGARAQPAQRWDVVPGVQMLPFRTPTLPPATHTNSYLIGTAEALLVEPATPYEDERERMVRWLDEARGDGIEPIAIFATHHHVDHVGAAGYLRERLGRPLWAHAMTAERLRGTVVFDRVLEDGEKIALRGAPDVALRCVHTPGHAPGHLCLIEERSRVMVCGDMVASVGTIIVEPTDGDMGLYLDSLRFMKRLAPSMLLPAHGLPIRDVQGLLDHYIAHRLGREAKVLAALEAHDGPAAPMDLVPRAYDDAPKAVWPLAAMALEAHLIKLERDGVARRSTAGWSALS